MATPMLTVDGVAMPCPSTLQWGLQDVSLSDSGRTQNGTMQKNRICQKRKLQLGWNGPTASDVSKILKAFNPEYIKVRYPDAMSNEFETRTFYVGDRSAPYKCYWSGNHRMETLTFDIIER